MKHRTFAFSIAMTLFVALGVTGQTSAQGPIFAPVVAYAPGGYGSGGLGSVAVGDVNGDGQPDLVVANKCGNDSSCVITSNGTVGVLLGNGDGTFQTAVTYSSGVFGAYAVAVADVNGDRKPDLVVANLCASSSDCNNGSVSVLLGNGDGTFQTALTYGVGNQPMSVVVADVNGDGKPDLVVTNYSDGEVSVLLGNGDGTFQTLVSYSSGGSNTAYSVAVGDLNRDGKPDLVVTNLCVSSPCAAGGVGVLLGNGDGSFQAAISYGSGGNKPEGVAIGDVNGDGKPDLLIANCAGSAAIDCRQTSDSTVGVLLGNGDGTFQTAVTYSSGGTGTHSVAMGDVNGDGHPDMVVTYECLSCNNAGVGVLLGNGDGTFQTAVTYSSGGFDAISVAVADVNGDGKPDLVVANSCTDSTCATRGPVGVLLNITPWPYKALVQQPINSDGSSIFNAKRGVIPVKFTLTQNGTQTCALPPATISVTRTAGGTLGAIEEASYLSPADNGSDFRIDAADCQYIYNLAAKSLGVGVYWVDISINGFVVGSGSFALK
jgi:hypothetical protein